VAKEYAIKFYSSKAWHKTRYSYIVSKGGLCERCGAGAKLVHHKNYITPDNINDYTVTLNHNNLELLCQDCHNLEHMATQPTIKGLRFDSDGQLIPHYTPATQ